MFHCHFLILQPYLKWYWFWIGFRGNKRQDDNVLLLLTTSRPRRMVIWRRTKLFIQQNVLMCDLAILFVGHRPQRCHGLLNNWPWSGRVSAIQEVRHYTIFPINSPKFFHICNGCGQFFKTNLNIWCTFEKNAQLITKIYVVVGSVTPIRIQQTNRIYSTSYQPVQTLSLNDLSTFSTLLTDKH